MIRSHCYSKFQKEYLVTVVLYTSSGHFKTSHVSQAGVDYSNKGTVDSSFSVTKVADEKNGQTGHGTIKDTASAVWAPP